MRRPAYVLFAALLVTASAVSAFAAQPKPRLLVFEITYTGSGRYTSNRTFTCLTEQEISTLQWESTYKAAVPSSGPLPARSNAFFGTAVPKPVPGGWRRHDSCRREPPACS